ncbi:4-hydroxybenzoate 3-monooxygenase [Amycolatopsis thermophila]|uniref:p-hydroxybenzoate 3-monooxygenase n=1 Tax=Amycolatopsis thermophila TaxID=206084 RepID=A0ABU0F5S0_9PSEU|nr:4-hydroxybenzoate 3-monooxygenase [Amycolatopsis thermophila]MDQ0382936.1 p-hydroxybenzoate 3-monooxygenase [Amycolatopsis thermophila]
MRTQVGIVGAGPAGLLLSQLLSLQGIESVVLERRSRDYVERRVRAGVLEHGTVQTLREAGVAKRLDEEGLVHDGLNVRFAGHTHRLDLADLVGRGVTVYGQQEVVKDLIAARLDAGGDLRFEIAETALHDLDGQRPRITFVEKDAAGELDCDFVVGADGFHGISRQHVPGRTEYEHTYPYAWLGILADAPPALPEVVYARHPRGFALHSMRSPAVARLYLQVAPDEDLAEWPDERIWAELRRRLGDDEGFRLTEGTVLDKGITPMRSFVSAPMQHGRLLLAGDAAHIVPPTGAKGMNLAVADVRLLSRALGAFYLGGRTDLLAAYTETALRRVWRATHFSWWMTSMLHRAPDENPFTERLATAQLDWVVSSRSMATALAENYTGLPYEQDWSYR